MIKSALPYLTFDGNCDEALSFYEEIFEAKVVEKALASEYNIETKNGEEMILNAILLLGENKILVGDKAEQYDGLGTRMENGGQISIWLEIETEDNLNNICKKLREKNCEFLIDLHETFWNSKYVKIEDNFGIIWELNYQKN
ncbi:VOC family protein [Sebaldella sp. S0638]|uniref:VOC family protein n=1 Tax=Sebaldella sp. S0638 TaxID=2957809 RepID=UPI00209ED9E6|nr:VOC family protein [Sebaldella sp. S0638]MCP1226016.1 VOC family protein [Sebaldella sp. S0638]